MPKHGIWFLAVRCRSGADIFTEQLTAALNRRGVRAGITWLPHRAEYAPWTVPSPMTPGWAGVVHINTWLHPKFLPHDLPILATIHSCVHDPALEPFKGRLQSLYHRFWVHRLESACIHRARNVVAVSSYTAGKAQNVFGRQDIQVIHNGIDRIHFFPPPRTIPHQPFRLLYVGNWSKRKGVDLLGPIMRKLGPGFELRYTADRQEVHKRYSLPTNCIQLGRISGHALTKAYQEADALLFPTRLEGFGLVIAEAMACGLPVIATDGSALPEVVQDRQTGILCARDDIGAFCAAARLLSNNHSLWQSMSRYARSLSAKFDIETMTDKYLSIYSNMLDP